MAERPILFSGDMVRAILEGRKTQARWVVKPQPPETGSDGGAIRRVTWNDFFNQWDANYFGDNPRLIGRCPFGVPGDTLWVRETHRMTDLGRGPCVQYQAGGDALGVLRQDIVDIHDWSDSKWRPSIHMPRWASRITLRVTGVRVERVQEISADDALSEGVTETKFYDEGERMASAGAPRSAEWLAFAYLWQSRYGPDSWEANPWVWVVEFEKEAANG